MVSAAIGAESFYSLDNNAGRSESLQFAKTVIISLGVTLVKDI
jgi:hypothetical protein